MAIGDTLNLVTNGSFEQKMNLLIQTINTNAIPHNDIEKIIFCLSAIANSRAATQKDEFKMDSLYTVQAIVRLGLASQLLPVGDQLVIDKGDTSYAYDIIDHNNDIACDSDGIEIPNTNTLTIQMHDCLPNSYYFDMSGSPQDHWVSYPRINKKFLHYHLDSIAVKKG